MEKIEIKIIEKRQILIRDCGGNIGLYKEDNGSKEVVHLKNQDMNESQRINRGLLWHNKLGHASRSYLVTAAKTSSLLKNINFGNNILNYESCIKVKFKRLPYKKVKQCATKVLVLVHSDIIGYIQPSSFIKGYHYVISFIDNHTRAAIVYLLHTKSEAGDCLKLYLDDCQRKHGKDAKILTLRYDRESEYTGE